MAVEEIDPEAPKGKSKLLIIIIAVVVLLVGGGGAAVGGHSHVVTTGVVDGHVAAGVGRQTAAPIRVGPITCTAVPSRPQG